MMHPHRLILIVSCLWASVAHADPPEVRHLFPAGAQAGHDTLLKVTGKPGTAPLTVRSDRPEVVVTPTDKPEEFLLKTPLEFRPGVVWLRWHNAEGASEPRPVIIGTLPELNEVEPNNAAKEAQAVAALPIMMNGALQKRGDVDSYAVTLTAGQTLVASVEAHRTLPSSLDAVLQIADARGFVLEQNEDQHGTDPQIAWTVPQDGQYIVRVFAFPSQPDSSINYYGDEHAIYRLLLTTGPVIDHIVPLVRQPGAVTAHGWNLTAPQVTLIAEGTWLGLDPTSGSIPIPGFAPAQLPLVNGPVHVEDETVDSAPMPVPSSVTGSIGQPDDVDRYRITATKGQNIRFRIDARSLGSSLDAILRLRNSEGAELKEQDDVEESPDPHFTHAIPADGDYVIEVTDRFRSGSSRHFYALTTQIETAEFDLGVSANRFVLDATKPLEIPVTVTRRGGLAVPITVTVEGLPVGATCEPGLSAPEGDSSKAVTLKLITASEAAAFSGPIRIIGRTSSPDLSHEASSPIDGIKARTNSLWVTVKATGGK